MYPGYYRGSTPRYPFILKKRGKEDFDDYMDGETYSWECQIAECQKWYNENIGNKLENPTERTGMLDKPCHNGKR